MVVSEVSAFVTDALQQYMALRRQRAALQTGFGAWTDEAHSDLKAPEDSTAYVERARNDAGRIEALREKRAK